MFWNIPVLVFLSIFLFWQLTLAEESLVNIGSAPLRVKAAGSSGQPRLGIVSTWRGHSETLANSWIRYHIAIGFTRIYLFFDDPQFDENLIDVLSKTEEYRYFVTIIKTDKKHRKKFWTPSEKKNSKPEQLLLPAYGVYLETDHVARQIMNVARAGVMAKADNLDWLLHIDADELLWTERLKSGCAWSIFNQLNNKGITHVILFNDEVAPLTPNFDYKRRPKDPFHQRMHFKRNLLTFRDFHQNQLAQDWAAERGVDFFIGYMCGKGAINVKLWRKNFGDDAPILPQHVVAFAYDSWQPGNITLINEDPHKLQPFISSKKVKISVLTRKVRVLHYVNSDFESMKQKLRGKNRFNTNIFDISTVDGKRKKDFIKWERNWAKTEKVPNWKFYERMWSIFRESNQKNNFQSVLDFYTKAAVASKGKKLDEYLKKGVIYKTKEIFQLLSQIEKLLEKKKIDKIQMMLNLSNGIKFIHGGEGAKNKNETLTLHRCKIKAPHFFCEIEDCCQFTTHAQFTFTKRLLGYKRYDRLQWWKPGIKWPQ